MILIKQDGYALVHHTEQFVDSDAINLYVFKQLRVRRHLNEREATTQGNIKCGQ